MTCGQEATKVSTETNKTDGNEVLENTNRNIYWTDPSLQNCTFSSRGRWTLQVREIMGLLFNIHGVDMETPLNQGFIFCVRVWVVVTGTPKTMTLFFRKGTNQMKKKPIKTFTQNDFECLLKYPPNIQSTLLLKQRLNNRTTRHTLQDTHTITNIHACSFTP